ncbi:MAG TPA: nucleotidyltransferase domain-containing protein [Azospirillum sp.]
MPDTIAGKSPDPLALDVVRELKARLRRRFGDRLVAVYLFGSRARGDHRPDSDADVAVFLRGDLPDPFDAEKAIVEDGYDLLLERGLYIQPWAFEERVLSNPDQARLAGLQRSVLTEGVRV